MTTYLSGVIMNKRDKFKAIIEELRYGTHCSRNGGVHIGIENDKFQ